MTIASRVYLSIPARIVGSGSVTVTYANGIFTISGTGISDGDKGDITVSASGATFTIDNDVVTYAKMQNISNDQRILGRISSGAGDPEELTGADLQTFLGGRQSLPIPAAAMTGSSTNGAAPGSVEMATNKNMFVTLDFDATTSESAQFSMAMPKSWNEGTITFQPIWSHPATAVNFGVVWALSAVAVSDDDAGDVAFGTSQTSTDTGGTTNDIYIGPESAAITVAGTPQAEDFVFFKIERLPANASDTLAVDARLHGIRLFITTSAGTDL